MTDNSSVDELTGLLCRQAFLLEVREAQETLPQRVIRGCLLILHFPIVRDMYESDNETAANDAFKHLLAIVETRLRSKDTLGRIGKHSLCIFLRQCKEADALIVADQHAALLHDVLISVDGDPIPLDFHYRVIPLDAKGRRSRQGVSKRVFAAELKASTSLGKTLSVAGNDIDLSSSSVISLNDVRKEVPAVSIESAAADSAQAVLDVDQSRSSRSFRLRPGMLISKSSLICCFRVQSVASNDQQEQLQDSVLMASVLEALSLNVASKRPVVESQLIMPVHPLQLNVQFPEWIKQQCQLMRVAPSDICLSIPVETLSEDLRAMVPILRNLNRAGIRLMIENVSSAAQFRMMRNLATFDYLYVSSRRLQASLNQDGERNELKMLIDEARHHHAEICCGGIDSPARMKLALSLQVEIGFGRECGKSVPFPVKAWRGS